MAGVTQAGGIIDAATRTEAMQGVVDTTFRNDEVLGRFRQVPDLGATGMNRKMLYGSNTSVGTYSEGDAAGIAGAQSYVTAIWPFTYYKAVVQITGHARDQLRNGAPSHAFFDQFALEFTKGVADIRDKASTDALGTGLTAPVGIQGICDSAGTIAGLSRSTYTWFAAYEASSASTVTLADLDLAERSLTDAEYASSFDQWWTSHKQIEKLRGAIGLAGATSNSVRIMSGGPVNLSGVNDGVTLSGRPFIPIRNLTDSVFLAITSSELFIGFRRQMTVDEMGKIDDSDKFLLTMAVGIGSDNPKHFGKLTGYTA